ncbi:outer membrane protein assembly factor BamD [Croceivirga sp. JEA036]|uniref:outer membrane protein assembly factor BamD n=1 Tax=Croceivirga sp. JEA036 TaxID=2721162 RepID=UPI00143A9595|nr:outer membrane protein assembly factor BamD [Croceivirga sp. JEA036]NJB35870.1 outer membrane protein assembly factor BamD [Croceivirga sp. JEA036]
MFWKKSTNLIIALMGAIVLTSCNEYQKVLKNEDVKAKYDLAERYYNEGDFKRANRLFEQIAPKYIGKPQGERVMFFFANSYFKTKQYYLAGYQFERFIKSYPQSDKLQEASFLEGKSYYKMSPKYSLDQTDTDKALAKLQNFINTFPESEYFEEANNMAQELTTKKQRKELEIAKQFDKLGEFNYPILISSMTAFNNFITDNPGSVYREDAFYYRLKSAMTLAENSVAAKQEERYQEALDYYKALLKSYPETKYKKEVDKFYEVLKEELNLEQEEVAK